MKNWGDNVFDGIPVGADEPSLFGAFLAAHDLASHSRRAFTNDIKKFARWFATANGERFTVGRVTTETSPTSENHLRRDRGQAVPRSIATWSPFVGSSAGWLNMAISPPIPPSRSRN